MTIDIRFTRFFVCNPDIKGWGISPRGAGYLFGHDVVSQVCMSNHYNDIHEILMEGHLPL